jgi:hypothetical protein
VEGGWGCFEGGRGIGDEVGGDEIYVKEADDGEEEEEEGCCCCCCCCCCC